jgi:hypothetical protein
MIATNLSTLSSVEADEIDDNAQTTEEPAPAVDDKASATKEEA